MRSFGSGTLQLSKAVIQRPLTELLRFPHILRHLLVSVQVLGQEGLVEAAAVSVPLQWANKVSSFTTRL